MQNPYKTNRTRLKKWIKFVKGGAWTQSLLTVVNADIQSLKNFQHFFPIFAWKHVQPYNNRFLSYSQEKHKCFWISLEEESPCTSEEIYKVRSGHTGLLGLKESWTEDNKAMPSTIRVGSRGTATLEMASTTSTLFAEGEGERNRGGRGLGGR